jgi:uncharacterized protein (DUF58 family)
VAGPWRRTAALERAVAATALLALLAVLLRRADLAVLAAPFALGTAFALARQPAGAPRARLSVSAAALLEGDPVTASVRVSGVDGADGVDLVAVAVGHSPGVEPRRWRQPVARVGRPGAGGDLDLRAELVAVRWGRARFGPVRVTAVAAHGLLSAGAEPVPPLTVPVWPLRDVFAATDAMPQAAGMVGPHRSRRPGEGSDVAEVRQFHPGDRLRRVNWRVSLREQRLHVTATESDRDTDVVLCLDTRHEVRARDVSSLDLLVRAAAALAEHYLRAGDRVSMLDLGQPLRRVRPGAGRAHLTRLLDVLLDVRGQRRADDATTALALSELPRAALVVVLSPLLGEQVFGQLAVLARSGRAVVVVDTLPPGAGPDEYGPWTLLAWRLWGLQRRNDVGRLAELGVPVVPWRGSGSLDEVLRDVSRAARAPRVRG